MFFTDYKWKSFTNNNVNINTISLQGKLTSLDSPVVKLSDINLVGNGFATQYRLPFKAGF